jgi:hypothetical protein
MVENSVAAGVLVALKTLAFLSNQMLLSTSMISELVEPCTFDCPTKRHMKSGFLKFDCPVLSFYFSHAR